MNFSRPNGIIITEKGDYLFSLRSNILILDKDRNCVAGLVRGSVKCPSRRGESGETRKLDVRLPSQSLYCFPITLPVGSQPGPLREETSLGGDHILPASLVLVESVALNIYK